MATPGPRLSHSHRECLIASRPPTCTPSVPAGPGARDSQDESDRSNLENGTILVWHPTLARGPIPIEPVPLARLIVRVVSQQAHTGRPLRRHLQRIRDRGKSVRMHRRLRLAVQSGVQVLEHPPGLALKLHGLVDSRIGTDGLEHRHQLVAGGYQPAASPSSQKQESAGLHSTYTRRVCARSGFAQRV